MKTSNHRRIWLAAALTPLLAGCGNGSATTTAETSTSATTAATQSLPKNCSTNADGKITKLDRKADKGLIKAKRLGSKISFTPSKDIYKAPVKKGEAVFFTYTKTSKGGSASCIIPMK